jgi:PRTRC genetic system protein E
MDAMLRPWRVALEVKIQFHPGGFISMFKELAPLVRHRAVLFTVSHVEDDQFRVNVIPKKVSEADNDALTTPVSVTGSVEDLDRDLPQTLLNFVSSHLELKNTLERAKAEMEEASKAARAEARKKSGSQATKRDPADSTNKPAPTSESPVPVKSDPPRAASLFDTSAEPATPCVPVGTAARGAGTSRLQPEIDEDEESLRESYAQDADEEPDEAA